MHWGFWNMTVTGYSQRVVDVSDKGDRQGHLVSASHHCLPPVKYSLYILPARFLWCIIIHFIYMLKLSFAFPAYFQESKSIKCFYLYMCSYVSSSLDNGGFSSSLNLALPSLGHWLQQGLSLGSVNSSIGPGCLCLYLMPMVDLNSLSYYRCLERFCSPDATTCVCFVLLLFLSLARYDLSIFRGSYKWRRTFRARWITHLLVRLEPFGTFYWRAVEAQGITLCHCRRQNALQWRAEEAPCHIPLTQPGLLRGTRLLPPVLTEHPPKSRWWIWLIQKQGLSIRFNRNLFSETVFPGFYEYLPWDPSFH